MAPPEPAEDDDLDDVLDLEPRSKPTGRRPPRGVHRRPPRRTEPVRSWRSDDADDPIEDAIDDGAPKRRGGKPPVFWRARDSLYFEPLVALAIIVLLLVSLFAYTSNWPPVYVVESNSMQHGAGDHLGFLNAGDIVLAQKASQSSIVTYVGGLSSGFSTYGESGDVILYYPNGTTSATPIVHRAIIYLEFDPHNNSFNATGLAGLACGQPSGNVYSTPGTAGNCSTTYLTNLLKLYNVGGRTVTVDFTRLPYLGEHSGYLTLGDNNTYPDQLPPSGDPFSLSTLVKPGWVIGVARGLIPWFGALKLMLDGNAGKVPTASWEYMGLSIAGLIFAALGAHLLLKRRRELREGRPRRDAEDEDDEDEARPTARRAPSLRPWSASARASEDDKPAASARRPSSYDQRRRSHFVSSREEKPVGRPAPKAKPKPRDDDDTA